MVKRRPDPLDESPIDWLDRERSEQERRERETAQALDERRAREQRALERFTEKFGDDAYGRIWALERLRSRDAAPAEADPDLLRALEVRVRVDRIEQLAAEREETFARFGRPSQPGRRPGIPGLDRPFQARTPEGELAELDEIIEALEADGEGLVARLGAEGAVGPETGGRGWHPVRAARHPQGSPAPRPPPRRR